MADERYSEILQLLTNYRRCDGLIGRAKRRRAAPEDMTNLQPRQAAALAEFDSAPFAGRREFLFEEMRRPFQGTGLDLSQYDDED